MAPISKCNLCGGGNFYPKYEIRKFAHVIPIVQCDDCGLIFQYPQYEHQQELYNEGYYKGRNEYSYIDEREDKFLRDIENERRIKNLLSFVASDFLSASHFSLLDVGSSFGSLVEKACELSIDAHGLDISDYATRNSEKTLCGDVCDFVVGSYDMITMIETIEHLIDPFKALENCYNAINYGGILLVQTTNMDSLVRWYEGSNSRYFLPGHLFYFSKKTLTAMLEKVGFKVIQIYHGHETGLIPALVRKSICNMNRCKRYNLPDWLVLLYTMIVHLFSKIHMGNFAVHNGMVVIARKVSDE